jgi:C4-dicarboxylate-binding protein DctP
MRAIIDGAIKDSTTYANAIASTENAIALDKIKASGKSVVYMPTAAEMTEWKKALMPVHEEMASRVGKDTVAAAYKAAGFMAPK